MPYPVRMPYPVPCTLKPQTSAGPVEAEPEVAAEPKASAGQAATSGEQRVGADDGGGLSYLSGVEGLLALGPPDCELAGSGYRLPAHRAVLKGACWSVGVAGAAAFRFVGLLLLLPLLPRPPLLLLFVPAACPSCLPQLPVPAACPSCLSDSLSAVHPSPLRPRRNPTRSLGSADSL